jgi:hypothetical protein
MIVLTPPTPGTRPRRIDLISEHEAREFLLEHELEDRDFISEVVRQALHRWGLPYVYYGTKKWKIMERFIIGEIQKNELDLSEIRGEIERARFECDC